VPSVAVSPEEPKGKLPLSRRRYRRAAAKAEELLRECPSACYWIATDVLGLAEFYGFQVRSRQYARSRWNFLGHIRQERKLIVVNKDIDFCLQKFAIAHLMGRFFLGSLEDFGRTELWLRPLASERLPASEQEANWFAANLLIPENLLKEYRWKKAWVCRLEFLFGVPENIVRYRLGMARRIRQARGRWWGLPVAFVKCFFRAVSGLFWRSSGENKGR
jgi:Zn-dependent peptidase ImmA (M78 family)